MKILLATFLITCCTLSFAQKKIDIKYYVNDTEHAIEEVKIFFVTTTDTITPSIVDGKIRILKDFKDNFSMFAKIDGRTMKIGSYRPATFNGLDAIVVGRVTDFSTLKRYWEWKDSFILDKKYVFMIPDYQQIADVIYFTVRKDVNISLHSNFTDYEPSYTYGHEIIAKK